MAHRSWCAEHPGTISNERLEFLGDAVLGWVVADLAFRRFAELPEGELTGVRKGVVNALALAEVAEELDLGAFLLLGRGEDAAGGREKPSILSDALEAVLGAVYVDGGPAAAYDVVERLIGPRLAETAAHLDHLDHKSRLQELVAADGAARAGVRHRGRGTRPRQALLRHGRRRRHRARRGPGRSKKAAEQAARGRRPAPRARRRPRRPMPELPEVETVRRGLGGARRRPHASSAVEVGRERTVRRTSAQQVIDGLTGATVLAAERRGKYLLVPARHRRHGDGPPADERAAAARRRPEPARPAHTHVAAAPRRRPGARSCGSSTRGRSARSSCSIPTTSTSSCPSCARLGVDPLRRRARRRSPCERLLGRPADAPQAAAARPARHRRHRQHLRRRDPPRAPGCTPSGVAGSLRGAEIVRLHDAMHSVLAAAVGAGGSTLGRRPVRRPDGRGGSYQDDHRVYGRAGERCLTCGRGIMRRSTTGGRSTHCCPVCQRAATHAFVSAPSAK